MTRATNEDTRAQKGRVPCLRSHSQGVAEWGFEASGLALRPSCRPPTQTTSMTGGGTPPRPLLMRGQPCLSFVTPTGSLVTALPYASQGIPDIS